MTSTPTTTWQRIARDITERIASGETPVGSKIASHQQLIQRHGASLGTVKRAVEYLQAAGVLQGVQGSGVFVRRQPREEDLGFDSTAERGDLASLRKEIDDLRAHLGEPGVRLAQLEARVQAIEDRLTQIDARG